jgi:hypothetical protein
MRKDCAEKLVIGRKNKKVRRSSPLYKKPIPRRITLGELVELTSARGTRTVFVYNGYQVVVEPRNTRA